MLVSNYYLRDSIVRLNSLSNNITKTNERFKKVEKEIPEEAIQEFKNKFYGIAIDMLNALEENIFALDHYTMVEQFRNTKEKILNSQKQVRDAEDPEEIAEVINGITADYKDFEYDYLNTYNFRYGYRDAYGAYEECEIEEIFLQMFGKQFKTPNNRTIHILDARPRFGDNMRAFKEVIENPVVTYGAAVPERNAYRAKQVFDKVALGIYKGSLISNEVFDVMLIQPTISLDTQNDRLIVKRERDLIRDTIKYLRPGGYIALILPYFRFHKDICLTLSKYFDNVQVRKFSGSSFDKTGAIFVSARKKEDKEINEETYKALRYLYNLDKVKNIISEPFEDVMLPEEETSVRYFRGSILDVDEIKELFDNSPSMKEFWKEQKVEKLSEHDVHPLLPFNTGQLGLILTSGVLDGIVDEGNGYYHVVKGRIVKKTDANRDVNGEVTEMELTETTSNRVEINVMLPDGTHKVLA